MEGKLILFVVVASLAQCSADYGLSEEQQAIYSTIENVGREMVEKTVAATERIVVILEERITELANNPESTNEAVELNESLESWKSACNSYVDLFPTLWGTSADVIDETKLSIHAILDHLFAAIAEAILAAGQGTEDSFETHESQLKQHFADLTQVMWGLLPPSDNANVQNMLADQRTETANSYGSSVDAFTNALKIYKEASVKKEATPESLAYIRVFGNQAVAVVRDGTKRIIAVVGSIHVQPLIGVSPDYMKALNAIILAKDLTTTMYQEELDILFNAIVYFVEALDRGIVITDEDGLSYIEAVKVEAGGKVKDACLVNVGTAATIWPEEADVFGAAAEKCQEHADEVMDVLVSGMIIAAKQGKDHPASRDLISEAWEGALVLMAKVYPVQIKLVHRKTFSDAIEEEIVEIKDSRHDMLESFGKAMWGSYEILNDATVTMTIPEVYAAMEAPENEARTATRNFVSSLAQVNVLVLKGLSSQVY